MEREWPRGSPAYVLVMVALTDIESESLRTFDWTATQQPSLSVIQTIADLENTDPLALNPLATVIDPDALNCLVTKSTRSTTCDCTVTFTYCGYTLHLTPEGGTVHGNSAQERPTAETQQDSQGSNE